jgi:hypothetical protein
VRSLIAEGTDVNKLLEVVQQMDEAINLNPAPADGHGRCCEQLAGLLGQALALGLLDLVKKATKSNGESE